MRDVQLRAHELRHLTSIKTSAYRQLLGRSYASVNTFIQIEFPTCVQSFWILWSLVLALVTSASVTPLSASQKTTKVWVNTRSGVYHCSGTLHYGRTSRGKYAEESEAIAQGFRASAGQNCAARNSTVVPHRASQRASASGLVEPAPPKKFVKSCVLLRIADADTIECIGVGKVRLIGIDAPEQSQRPYSQMSESALRAIVPIFGTIDLEFDATATDRYGRTLAYVWYNGHMVNWRLVRNGWAMSFRFPPDVRHSLALTDAEGVARAERRGLWNVNGFSCIPSARRRARC